MTEEVLTTEDDSAVLKLADYAIFFIASAREVPSFLIRDCSPVWREGSRMRIDAQPHIIMEVPTFG